MAVQVDRFSQLNANYLLQLVAKMPSFNRMPTAGMLKDAPQGRCFVFRRCTRPLGRRACQGTQFVHF
ncbi:hypothetical protein EMIT0P44_50188 [Pseudomonas sp. IT-P44]